MNDKKTTMSFPEKAVVALATGFGLGLSPVAPGTVGALLGVLIAFPMGNMGWQLQLLAAVILSALAVPISSVAEKHLEYKDDVRIVADEFMTFPLCVVGLPWPDQPWLLAAAFVSSRLFDVLKPPPARGSQAIRGGLGIVLDDFLANLYSLAFNHGLYWLFVRFTNA